MQKFGGYKKTPYLCIAFKTRAFSSAGLEHLPYKQRVGGSNPSTPTSKSCISRSCRIFCFIKGIICGDSIFICNFAEDWTVTRIS